MYMQLVWQALQHHLGASWVAADLICESGTYLCCLACFLVRRKSYTQEKLAYDLRHWAAVSNLQPAHSC